MVEEIVVKLWRPQDGDILVVRNTEIEIDSELAADLKRAVRRDLGLPDSVRIMAVGRDWEVTVVREDDDGSS